MSMEKPYSIHPDNPTEFKLPKPKLERGENSSKLEIKREGGRLVIRPSKRGASAQ